MVTIINKLVSLSWHALRLKACYSMFALLTFLGNRAAVQHAIQIGTQEHLTMMHMSCCTSQLVAAHFTWLLHIILGCCTSQLVAAHFTWLLHMHIILGCCTFHLAAAQFTWLLHILIGCCTSYLVLVGSTCLVSDQLPHYQK